MAKLTHSEALETVIDKCADRWHTHVTGKEPNQEAINFAIYVLDLVMPLADIQKLASEDWDG